MKNIFFIMLFLTPDIVFAVSSLSTYKIDSAAITISGLSGGGFMATQMSTAYSKIFSGSANVSGGIFWCAQGSLQKAQNECMNLTSAINSQVHIAEVKRLAAADEIDPLENLAKQKYFIFSSKIDASVRPPSGDKLYEFLKEFVPVKNIKFDNQHEVAHGFPTLKYGANCKLGGKPWILNCNLDTAGDILNFMYPHLKKRSAANRKNLIIFEQAEFDDLRPNLYKQGWVYVPTACQTGQRCRLHVALHGCRMSAENIESQFAEYSGFNEWAESNDIVILYPQSLKQKEINPRGCWDWFGFTGANYVTKKGKQMVSLKAMIDRIVGRRL